VARNDANRIGGGHPLLFAAISGAHLYGFGFPTPLPVSRPASDVRFANRGPSPDSDYDLRGAHVLPLDAFVGLEVRDDGNLFLLRGASQSDTQGVWL